MPAFDEHVVQRRPHPAHGLGDATPAAGGPEVPAYLKHFPREQLLLVTSESLRTDRRSAMRRVHDFIGVNSDWSTPDQDREFSSTDQKTAPGLFRRGGSSHAGRRAAALARTLAGKGC